MYCKYYQLQVLPTASLVYMSHGSDWDICRTIDGKPGHHSKVLAHVPICLVFLQILVYPIFWLVGKTPWQGAQTTIYCAISEELEGVSGQYLADCKIQQPKTAAATDDNMAERLWQLSCRMVGLEEEKVEE